MAEINLGNDTDINVTLDEQTNLSANVYDINYIPDYVKAEQERRANETIRIANENQRIENEEARQDYYNLIQQKVENGDFDGEDGVSPVVTTSKTDGVTTITIQDVEGTKTATILDGVNGNKVWYGEITTKPTLSGTTVKIEATTDNDYTLEKGRLIVVKYTLSSITYSGYGYTLNVNGTGEKTIYWGTSSRPAAAGDPNFYGNGQTWLFVYDGTYYRAVETRFASTSTYGFTKLSDSVSSTSSDLSATSKAVKQAYDKATSVETAAKEDYAHTLTMSYTPATKSVNVGIANYNGDVLDSGAIELSNLATTDSVDTINDYVFGEESVSGEGTSLQLTDTLKGKLKSLECKGNTSQVQYTGNQLIDFASPTSVKLTTTSFTNNVLSVVGSAGSYPNVTWDILDLVKNNSGKTLKIKFDNISVTGGVGGIVQLVVTNNGSTSYVGMVNRSGQVAASYNIPSDTSNLTRCDFTIYTSSSGSATAETITMTKPLVYFNNNDTYEPYVGGTASPNPSYPQNVNVVSGDNTIEICGKNLFDKTKITSGKLVSRIDGTLASNSRYSASDYIPMEENTTYTLDGAGTSTESFDRWYSACYDKNKNYIGYVPNQNTFTTLPNTRYMRFSVFTDKLDTALLVKGSTLGEYEPYIGNTYPISLGNIELCKIGTYQDYIYKDNGSWYVAKYIRKIELNISNMNRSDDYPGWNGVPYLNEDFPGLNAPTFPTTNLISNIGGNVNSFGVVTTNTNSILILNKSVWNLTQTQWKTNYPNLVFVLYYAISTPTTTQITDTTLIEQLEALSSVNGTTNINQENNDLPMILDIEAFKNNLNGKLGLLDILVKE